jgi:cytochrome c-type biogenesis protein
MQTTFVASFLAGLISFLSPCVLPLVPVYLASLVGPGIFETGPEKKHLPLFKYSMFFVLGFAVVFIFLGVAAGAIGSAITQYLPLVQTIAGYVLVIMGVFMIAAIKLPFLNYEKRLSASGKSTAPGIWRSFITGCVFSVAWTPCVGPVLGAVLAVAATKGTIGTGALLLVAYTLGLAIPFLVIGALLNTLMPFLKRVYRYSVAITIVGAALLIGVGILILTHHLTLISQLAQ